MNHLRAGTASRGFLCVSLTFCAIVVALLSGCATVEFRSTTHSVSEMVAFLDEASPDAIVARTALPFLFDAEIVMRAADIRSLWRTLHEQGFTFSPATVESVVRVNADSAGEFSDGWEVAEFFKKYVPSGAYIGYVRASDGHYLLLLGKQSGGLPILLGISGPRR